MNVPYAGVLVASNESIKESFKERGYNLGLPVYLLAGAGA